MKQERIAKEDDLYPFSEPFTFTEKEYGIVINQMVIIGLRAINRRENYKSVQLWFAAKGNVEFKRPKRKNQLPKHQFDPNRITVLSLSFKRNDVVEISDSSDSFKIFLDYTDYFGPKFDIYSKNPLAIGVLYKNVDPKTVIQKPSQ